MSIMKKRISLILGIIMLAVSIIPVVSVNATETCQVSMTAKMGSTTLKNNGKYNVEGGEKIVITAKSSVADIAFIAYYFSTESFDDRTKVYSDTATITVPSGKNGTSVNLYVEPVASNDDGEPNTITKTGWQKYTLVYPTTSKAKDLDVSYSGKTLKNGSTTVVKSGAVISVSATPASNVSKIYYKWASETTRSVSNSTATITIPTLEEGKTYTLKVNALYEDGLYVDGKNGANTTSEVYYFKLADTSSVVTPTISKDLAVKYNGKTLKNGSTTIVKAGEKVTISATPTENVSKIYYKWADNTMQSVNASSTTITIPTLKAGTIYKLMANALYEDGLYVDGKNGTNTTSEVYYFKLESTESNDRDLIIEPWMEENDNIEELSISLRNDSEEENKANKNIYELEETVTYFIDYANGGKDIDDVSIVLELPLDFDVVDADGGTVNKDEIEWVFENGLKEGESGTIVVKVKYTSLKKSKDDANTIYPTASILKGSKVKDVSTVINYIITSYDEEIDVDHDPYMYGDANADTFRPDYIITRAEGALVLARIFGLDYENVKTITTKYTDIGTTYLEAQKAITAASQAGLINGYLESDGTYTYRPNSKMTKAEFMKILACMIQEEAEENDIDGLQIKELDQLVKVYDDSTRYYMVDGKRVYTHWAIEEITLLARLNMLPLTEDEPEFELDEKITRAEVAQLINFYLLRAPAEVTSKTKTGFSDVSRKHDLAGDIIEATRDTHTFSITPEATEVEE